MLKFFKKVFCVILSFILVFGTNTMSFATSSDKEETKEASGSEESASDFDLAMVNYLAVKAYELSENKRNAMELENIQNLILNSLKIDKMTDDDTHKFIVDDFLPTVSKFKLDTNARRRVDEKLNERKANAITKGAKATAEAMTSIDTSSVAGGIVGGIGAAGVGISTYIDVVQEAETENKDLKFELDQNAINNIDGLKTKLLDYYIKLKKKGKSNVDDNQLLRDDDIKEFYNAKVSTNIYQKIDKLEDKEKTLSAYGPYWLERSKAYYQKALEDESENKSGDENYKRAIEAFKKYEEIDAGIYRDGKNIEYYKFVPVYLESVEKAKPSDYLNEAKKYVSMLDEGFDINIENWDNILYVVTLYEKLNEKTGDKKYLENAYETMRKMTVQVATELKNRNRSKNESDEMYEYDSTVAISISKLKSLAEKLNKSENDKLSLDKQVFGNDQKLFYNVWLDSAFAFADEHQDLYKQAKGEKNFETGKLSDKIHLITEKGKVTVRIEKDLLNSEYDPDFYTKAKDNSEKHKSFKEKELYSNMIEYILDDPDSADQNPMTYGWVDPKGELTIEISLPEALGIGNKIYKINYYNEDGYSGYDWFASKDKVYSGFKYVEDSIE